MKKLVVLAVVAFAAAVSQAAAIKWQSGVVKLPGEDGAQSGATMTAKNVAGIYLWSSEMSDVFGSIATWNEASKAYTLKTDGSSAVTSVSKGSFTAAGPTAEYSKGDTAYATAFIWYDADASGSLNAGDFYLAKSVSYALEADVDKNVALGLNQGSWTKVTASSPVTPPGPGGVPEPTSALLLVAGGAMLALRRKQK